jgi:predicted Zn-ribbon and HTH transcriptional regulator
MKPDENRRRTIRQDMIALLQAEECRLRDISQALHISEKEARDHLAHIRRSLSASRQALIISPAECLACGFIFKGRQRLTRPGRCPECRRTRISMPRFHIT